MSYDFSFSNAAILDYFEGRSKTPPLREFLYLNSSPTNVPTASFLDQLEALVLIGAQKLSDNVELQKTHMAKLNTIVTLSLSYAETLNKLVLAKQKTTFKGIENQEDLDNLNESVQAVKFDSDKEIQTAALQALKVSKEIYLVMKQIAPEGISWN